MIVPLTSVINLKGCNTVLDILLNYGLFNDVLFIYYPSSSRYIGAKYIFVLFNESPPLYWHLEI